MTNEINSVANGFCKDRAQPLETLDAVVLYDTVVMGKRGLSILAGLTGTLKDDLVEIRPRPWRLDLVQDPSAVEHATDDVGTAHVIIVSTSGQAPLPPAFKNWFAAILKQRQSKRENVAVIALLGLDESTAVAASLDFHFIKQQTLEADLEFFAPHFDGQTQTKPSVESKFVFRPHLAKPSQQITSL